MRIERSCAVIASIMANRYRKEGAEPFTMYDFAPHDDKPEITLDDWRKSVRHG